MDWTAINHGTLNDFEYPPILYKYRDWNSNHHDRFIKNREVFLASPSSFEDPKDCKNPVRYDLLIDDQILEWHENIARREHPHLNRQQRRYNARQWAKQKKFQDQKFLEEHIEKYNTEFSQREGVLSLTAEPRLPEMWDKYAGNDTGFCIGYNSRILFESLGGGGKVEYCIKLPVILPQPFMTDLEKRFKSIYTKEIHWKFEEEYRTERFWDNPASISDRQIKLPKSAFNRVILGNKISEANKEEITNSIREQLGNIPIITRKNVCEQCL